MGNCISNCLHGCFEEEVSTYDVLLSSCDTRENTGKNISVLPKNIIS